MDPNSNANKPRHASRRRLLVTGISAVLLLVLVIGALVGAVVNSKQEQGSPNSYAAAASSSPTAPKSTIAIAASINAVCTVAQYPKPCYSSLWSSAVNASSADPEEFFRLSLVLARRALRQAKRFPSTLARWTDDATVKEALQLCEELIGDSVDQLDETLAALKPTAKKGRRGVLSNSTLDDVATWLSAALTDFETCLDGFEGTRGGFREKVAAALRNSTELTSNSLAIASRIIEIVQKFKVPTHRKLMAVSALPLERVVDGAGQRVVVPERRVVPW